MDTLTRLFEKNKAWAEAINARFQAGEGTEVLMADYAATRDEIEEFRKLLERAREYDRRNGEPDCELDEKRQAILAIAKQLGVEISFL